MGVVNQRHAPAAFTPRKDPVPIVQEAGLASEPDWIRAENLAPTGIRTRTFQLVASRYTYWAIAATIIKLTVDFRNCLANSSLPHVKFFLRLIRQHEITVQELLELFVNLALNRDWAISFAFQPLCLRAKAPATSWIGRCLVRTLLLGDARNTSCLCQELNPQFSDGATQPHLYCVLDIERKWDLPVA